MSPPLSFEIEEGGSKNAFLKDGEVAVHVETSRGSSRLVVAFPAGNLGVAVWLEDGTFQVEGALSPSIQKEGMRGVSFSLTSPQKRLCITETVLANIRFIRSRCAQGVLPPEVSSSPPAFAPWVWERVLLDGNKVRFSLHPQRGTSITSDPQGRIKIQGGKDGISLHAEVLSDAPPLTPLPPEALVQEEAASGVGVHALEFLVFKELFGAGSWRYLTYFGRDTLITLALLKPILKKEALFLGLRSVLERLSYKGEVAHEEEVGEFAVWERMRHDEKPSSAPRLDRKMIDDDFLLAPVSALLLLGQAESTCQEFLDGVDRSGRTLRDALSLNLDLVVSLATPYGEKPSRENLIRLKSGVVGDWRDSTDGLCGGQYPYSVNGALVPAALAAVIALSRILPDPERVERAKRLLAVWEGATAHYRVVVPQGEARERISAWAERNGFDATVALSQTTERLAFSALSLGGHGKPIPILHSDIVFDLFFKEPHPNCLVGILDTLFRPFPLGLLSPVGLMVANPVLAPSDVQERCTKNHYHGTVVWSWPMAMAAAGLARQLSRKDLPSILREKVEDAQGALWTVIQENGAFGQSELWSWCSEGDAMEAVPFGADQRHRTEGNPIQLWSVMGLALEPPTIT